MFTKPDTTARSWVERAVSELERVASDQRTYRALEAVAIVGSVAAILSTYFLIGRGAPELNPIAEWILTDQWSGSPEWYYLAAGRLVLAVAVVFTGLRWISRWHPKYALTVALTASVVHTLNGLNDLAVLSQGFPDSFIWSNAAPFVAFTLLLAVGLASRHHLIRGINRLREGFSRRQGQAFILVILIATSVVAMPFMAGLSPDPDHDGVGSAEIETATLNNSYSISEDTNLRSVTFNNDGTKMFASGGGSSNVYEYDLSTPFDISTATYTQAKSVGGQDGGPDSVRFNDDGSKMYITGYQNDNIYEYDLSTSFDISTASHARTLTLSSHISGLAFNDDGSKMYTFRTGTTDELEEYSLSTPYDVTTASLSNTFYVGNQEGNPRAVDFNGDGTKMVIIGGNSAFYEYDLSTGYDVSTASYSGNSKGVSSEDSSTEGLKIGDSGSKLYMTGDDTDNVFSYDTNFGGYTHPLSGTVTDKDGNPIEGAAVGADDPDVSSTTTNSTGYYELAVPEAGTYEVTADDGDYVSTKSVDVPDGGISGVDFALGPANKDGQSIGLVEDEIGLFPADQTSLVVYERSTEYKSVEDGMSVDTWHETTWTKTETSTFNWENRTRVDLVNGRYYRFELEGPRDTWEDSGILYNDTEMSGSTIWLEPDTSSTDTNGDGTSGGDGSSGTNAGTGSTTTPTADEDGDFPTATEQQGFGPTALGTCSTLDGQDGLEVEYWDPNYETHELDANLTVDGSTTYYITKTWDDPRGYYRGCIADSMTDNATDEDDLGLNHTALDGEGEVLTSGRQSFQAPTFGPTGSAPESTGERIGLLAGVLAALGALWFGGNRYVPASSVKSWPSESINPAFGIGAPIVTVLGLDLAGGGVISAGVATGLAQIAPFAGIVGVTVGGYYALRWIRAPPSGS